jgi:hypothetical protein
MKSTIKTIIYTAIIAGCLDAIAAVVFLAKMNFAGAWRFVASGMFGDEAFSGGNEMVIYGLLFHFSIALIWTIVYYLFLRKVDFFINNKIRGGLLYGVVVWYVMNLIVLPITNIPHSPFTVMGIIKGLIIIILCVGLPISLLIQKSNKVT